MLGLMLVPACLFFIFGGMAVSSLLIYCEIGPPQFNEPLPLVPALYALLVWPVLWGITEQLTYNGYLLPRFQALSGNTAIAMAVIAFFWSFQHVVMPLTFDPDFIVYRLVSSLPNSLFMICVCVRLRRLLPLTVAHWLMDGSSAFIGSLCPLLR